MPEALTEARPASAFLLLGVARHVKRFGPRRGVSCCVHEERNFIESLLLNIPIPPVFLYEYDLNRYEVMDGQQRLNAVLEFYENRFTLAGLERWSGLNGLTYGTCPGRIQRGLDRRRLTATVLLAENARDEDERAQIRREVFERLNTGGQVLNAQELRNSLYGGPFNDLLIRLAGNRLFDEIWGIPPYEDHYRGSHISKELAENKLFSRMRDCEIVLRFFAFRRASLIGAVKSTLDRCMETNQHATPMQIKSFEESFTANLTTAHGIFLSRTFQIKTAKGSWRHSAPLFDAVMIALYRFSEHHDQLVAKRSKIRQDVEAALKNEGVYRIIVGKPNTAEAVRERINIISDIMKNAL